MLFPLQGALIPFAPTREARLAAGDPRLSIAERYADQIEALYDGRKSVFVSTEVTFEDGRKGAVSADLVIRNAKVVPVVSGGSAAPLRKAG